VALIVGRLSLEKDHLSLLRAVKQVRERHALHLVIVGDGPERPRIEAVVRELGIQDAVTLTGQQRSAEPFYGIADVAVLASRTEGSPNALLEAMAAGVPAVATTVGGIPEIATDGETALLVPPGDAAAIASALLAMFAEQGALAHRLTASAQDRIKSEFLPARRVARLGDVYRELLHEKDHSV
jgi:glycosyltransferase involved in cell wall biosynthesis